MDTRGREREGGEREGRREGEKEERGMEGMDGEEERNRSDER